MKELNNTVKYNRYGLASSEVQCSVLFSDNTKKHCTSLEGSKHSYIELAKTFKLIHIRLVSMGYVIEKGKIYKPN